MHVKTANGPNETRHFRNFNAIRLVAALSVVFSHSFLIAEGNDHNEPFVRMLGSGNILGVYGVFVFFVISGFLVTGSMHSSANPAHFLWKRALRIFPALAICAFACAFVVAPLFLVGASPAEYMLGLSGLDYAAWTSLLPASRSSIPGVQFYVYENGHPATLINGSLWTIGYEIICYLLIAALALFRLLRFPVVAGLLAVVAIGGSVSEAYQVRFIGNFFFLAPAFLAGSFLYYVHRMFGFHPLIAVACIVILIVCTLHGTARELFPLLGAYPVMVLAASSNIRLPSLDRLGDLSYGVYLYGWPIQQAARGLLGNSITWWQLFLISAAVALTIAWLSWHFVERPALSLKDVWMAPARRRGAGTAIT